MDTYATVDLHVDFIIQQRLFRYDVLKRHRAGFQGQPLFWHIDVPRMKDASYRGACLGIHYYPWESERAWRECNKQLDYIDEVISTDRHIVQVKKPEDWRDAFEAGRIAVAAGVEGAHMINGELDRVEALADRNIAYMTLTHFSKNSAATPSMGRGANETQGLTPFGRDLVQALEDARILIDVAHVNTPGVLDVCSLATRPLLCTHTGVKGVNDHVRNISDDEIHAIQATDGVIGIMFAPVFLTGSSKADHRCVLDHIDYVVEKVGVRHVGLGSDFDGWIPIPSDMRDCRDIELIRSGLEKRGYNAPDIARIMGVNALEILSGERG